MKGAIKFELKVFVVGGDKEFSVKNMDIIQLPNVVNEILRKYR